MRSKWANVKQQQRRLKPRTENEKVEQKKYKSTNIQSIFSFRVCMESADEYCECECVQIGRIISQLRDRHRGCLSHRLHNTLHASPERRAVCTVLCVRCCPTGYWISASVNARIKHGRPANALIERRRLWFVIRLRCDDRAQIKTSHFHTHTRFTMCLVVQSRWA